MENIEAPYELKKYLLEKHTFEIKILDLLLTRWNNGETTSREIVDMLKTFTQTFENNARFLNSLEKGKNGKS